MKAAGPGITSILVAANGANVDARLAIELREQWGVSYVYFEEGSSPKTIASVMPLIDTEYFGFLDDDDELLPNSLSNRLAVIQKRPDADILLSNGYLQKNARDSLYLNYLDRVPGNPLETFFMENWLPSCGALFRRTTVRSDYFQNYHPYAEWSWLAFRFSIDKLRFCVLNEPTFRIHADTPHSLSKSMDYRKTYISLYHRMLELEPPKHIIKILKKRLSQAHHELSSCFLAEGDIQKALYHHMISLKVPSGVNYLLYTRHIVLAALKR